MAQITRATKPVSDKNLQRDWKLVDLKGKILGRVANEIAAYLQGKNKTNYVTHLDLGDNVVVINAKKVVVSGSKADEKEYTFFSGYPGGLRKVSYKALLEKMPGEVIRRAVSGMLPKNKLRDQRLSRLFVFGDENHKYGDKFTQKAKLLVFDQ